MCFFFHWIVYMEEEYCSISEAYWKKWLPPSNWTTIKQLDDAFDLIFFLSLRESTFQQSFIRFLKKIQIKF